MDATTNAAFKLREDGSAVDPAKFAAALAADPEKLALVEADAELREVVLNGEADGYAALQGLLREMHKEEQERQQRWQQRQGERSIDAQRASAPVPRDTVQLYQQLRESGLEYGPAFRLLRNVHVPDTADAADERPSSL